MKIKGGPAPYHSHGTYDPNYDNDRFSGQSGDVDQFGVQISGDIRVDDRLSLVNWLAPFGCNARRERYYLLPGTWVPNIFPWRASRIRNNYTNLPVGGINPYDETQIDGCAHSFVLVRTRTFSPRSSDPG
jgi:hypothetical protein